jgi:hypothetical protein
MPWKRPTLVLAAIVAVFLTTAAGSAGAAQIRTVQRTGSAPVLVIEGAVAPGDLATFLRFVRDRQAAIADVYLFSPGGDFTEAMKIGRAMRALELSSHVPIRAASGAPSCEGLGVRPERLANCTCVSACFFMHVGATHRGGSYLAVHRPYYPRGEFGRLPQRDAMKAFTTLMRTATEYMDEMDVPERVQEDVLGTPSDRTLVLDEATIRNHFQGDLPYRDEWIRDKCAGVERCAAGVRNDLRLAAHERYFGAKPQPRAADGQ